MENLIVQSFFETICCSFVDCLRMIGEQRAGGGGFKLRLLPFEKRKGLAKITPCQRRHVNGVGTWLPHQDVLATFSCKTKYF